MFMFRTIVALIILLGLLYIFATGLYKIYMHFCSEEVAERKRLEEAKLDLDLADYTLTKKMEYFERKTKYD